MSKLILNALAFASKAGVPTQVKDVADVADVYIKNAFVSLTSARLHNPAADVCLITNTPLSKGYQQLFNNGRIPVYVIPFNAFAIPNSFHWQLAFFKLFALEFAVNKLDFDQYILLDSDAYSTQHIDDLWLEMEAGSILLYHLPSTYHELTRKQIIDGYKVLYGNHLPITNYGGEFIAGYRNDLADFSRCCMDIYTRMLAHLSELSTNIGDEFITSVAATVSGKKIVVANAYIQRFMTGRVYACYTAYDRIAIWHMPVEKSYTMMKLFNYYEQKGHFPGSKQVAAWAGLPENKRTNALPYFAYRIKQKLVKQVQNRMQKQ